MITASPRRRQNSARLTWQQQLADAVTRVDELADALDLDARELASPAAKEAFALRVPWSYVARMRRRDRNDPLLKQVLPVAAELDAVPGFQADPLAEHAALRAPGLLTKYHGRALIVATATCAVHCRYCFRREFPYAESTADSPRWSAALAAIAADASIEEVILSGGDPLSLGNARLASLTDALARIPHVRRLRVHTRQPIVLPARVDAGLAVWLERLPWPKVIVLHANHPNEIDAEVRAACERLRATGALLLNQSVLLRGVNDSVETLAELSTRLIDAGVSPYYLHLLDRVRGTAHFEVPEGEARELIHGLTARVPGYLVPRLVREIPGAPSKVDCGPKHGEASEASR